MRAKDQQALAACLTWRFVARSIGRMAKSGLARGQWWFHLTRARLDFGRDRCFVVGQAKSDRLLGPVDHLGGGRLRSRTSGKETIVYYEKLVDATYLEGNIPATSPSPFEVAPGIQCIPVDESMGLGITLNPVSVALK